MFGHLHHSKSNTLQHSHSTLTPFMWAGVPQELVKHWDPAQPLLVGGLDAGEEARTHLQLRLKRHRWPATAAAQQCHVPDVRGPTVGLVDAPVSPCLVDRAGRIPFDSAAAGVHALST